RRRMRPCAAPTSLVVPRPVASPRPAVSPLPPQTTTVAAVAHRPASTGQCTYETLRRLIAASVKEAVQQSGGPRDVRPHGVRGALAVRSEDRHDDRLVLFVGVRDIARQQRNLVE